MTTSRFRTFSTLMLGVGLGAFLHALMGVNEQSAAAQPAKPTPDLETLAKEVETLQGKLPDQAHAMDDVGHHFANLWFAAQQKNWALASFFSNETRSHLRWAVRIIPKRKDNAGKEIDLQAILQAFENTPWKQLQDAITAKDKTAFDKAYRFSLETCYACHKAADKPFIRPQIPTAPASPIINFDPSAEWPK